MKNFKVGLQLYGVRSAMEKDMDATLGAVKAMGYDYVEFAGYFGKTAAQVKALLDKHGLQAVSVHQAPALFREQGQSAIDYLKALGVKYCAIPWYELEAYTQAWDETVEGFTRLGEEMRASGIQLLYHNHDFEFNKIRGEYIIDKLYAEIPADLLKPELDTCWIRYAGSDPCEYIKKYSGRVDIVHLKDFVCAKLGGGPVYALIDEDGEALAEQSGQETGFMFKPVGSGMQDWRSILETASDAGTEYVIVEQDESYDMDCLQAARMSREYLRNTFGI